jgi:TatD DNase family protein
MLTDSHAHVDGPEFDADRDAVIERARAAGVTTILNVGTGDPHSGVFERAIDLSRKHPWLYTAIGTHPHDARFYDDAAEQKTRQLLQSSERAVAWGEIGLDFHYDNSPRDVQIDVFKRQLRAARNCDLPVIIHTREAEAETIEVLKTDYHGAERRGVFHCFTGSRDLAMHCYFSQSRGTARCCERGSSGSIVDRNGLPVSCSDSTSRQTQRTRVCC